MLAVLSPSHDSLRMAAPGTEAEVAEAFVSAVKRCGGDTSGAASSASTTAAPEVQAALLRPFLLHMRGDLEQKPLVDAMKAAELASHPGAVAALVDILWLLGTQVGSAVFYV